MAIIILAMIIMAQVKKAILVNFFGGCNESNESTYSY